MSEMEGVEMEEPQLTQLVGKLRKLQRDKGTLLEEIKQKEAIFNSLKEELSTLHTSACQLEETYKEKEDLCRKLQLQCEESEQDCARSLKQNNEIEERVEKYKCEIQEIKLKHRKLRMSFGSQLQQLTEEHKKLHSVFAPERLPEEIRCAENTNTQLLATEQIKLAQLRKLEEELEKAKKQLQLNDTTTSTPKK